MFENPLWQYLINGDLIGFINAVFTSRLGELWYALIVFAITFPLYLRTQSLIFVCILWILLGNILVVMVPISVFKLGYVLMVIGIGGLLYKLFRKD